jgi:hypothetical protein
MVGAMCSERLRLLAAYRETTLVYADAVRKMTDLLCLGVDTEVYLLRRACTRAWGAVEESRLSLSRHEADHGCDRVDFVPYLAGDTAN